eukprot:3090455-Rhodomonas_salina.1
MMLTFARISVDFQATLSIFEEAMDIMEDKIPSSGTSLPMCSATDTTSGTEKGYGATDSNRFDTQARIQVASPDLSSYALPTPCPALQARYCATV